LISNIHHEVVVPNLSSEKKIRSSVDYTGQQFCIYLI